MVNAGPLAGDYRLLMLPVNFRVGVTAYWAGQIAQLFYRLAERDHQPRQAVETFRDE